MSFPKVDYVNHVTHIMAENMNDIQDAITNTQIFYGRTLTFSNGVFTVECSNFTAEDLREGTVLILYNTVSVDNVNVALNVNNTGSVNVRPREGIDRTLTWSRRSTKGFVYVDSLWYTWDDCISTDEAMTTSDIDEILAT